MTTATTRETPASRATARVRISGPVLADVERARDDYLARYHPAGYDTSLSPVRVDPRDGLFYCEGSRQISS